MAKLATLVDAFAASTLNTAQWNSVTAGTVSLDSVNDRAVLACPTTAGGFNTLGATGPWDAVSSAIYARVIPIPAGSGQTQTVFKLSLDTNNSVAIRLASGVFKTTMQTAGTTVTTTLPTYDPVAHAYWRLRESSGNFLAETSPDGWTWTTLATMAYSWSASALSFLFQTNTAITEVAGLSASLAHVNTLTGGGNIAWPVAEFGWGAVWNANGGNSPLDRFVDLTQRSSGSLATQRGRQYELDQIQSGTATATFANTDGALDPTNVSGPWAGQIQPYQPFRARVQYPPTPNLLTAVQATGGDGYTAGTIPSSIDVMSIADVTGGQIIAGTPAFQGTNVFQFAVPSATATNTRICYTPQVAATPGQTYTVQLRVRDITASTTIGVTAFIGYYGGTLGASPTLTMGSTATLTGATAAGWTQITATVTLPTSGVFGMVCGVAVSGTVAATCSVQVDGWQLEKGSAASTFTVPGTWYPIYSGYVERWPSAWTMDNTYGVVQPTAVDAFALLSQRQLADPLTEEIKLHSPRFLFELDDPAGSQTATDSIGAFPAAPLKNAKLGAGSAAYGTAITATNTTTGVFTGSTGTVLRLTNPSPGATGEQLATFVSLDKAGITGPLSPSGEWSRMIAFRYTGTGAPSVAAVLWGCKARSSVNGSNWLLAINSSGNAYYSSNGVLTANASVAVADGNWHLAIVSYSPSATRLVVSVDGVNVVNNSYVPGSVATDLVTDSIGALVDGSVGYTAIDTFAGDLSYAAEFTTGITAADCTSLYTAWKSSCAGDSTDARYARILRYSGYTGPTAIQTGLTRSMGPANTDGTDALSALQAVVDTEGGEHFVDRSGAVTFKSRSARYNATTPVYTFGENAGEFPYEEVGLDYDPTHLANHVTVTQTSTGQTFTGSDAASQTAYFPRTMTRSIDSTDPLECQDAANYLLSRYHNPLSRVTALKLHPAANPALWPVCLSLELGMRVRVMRRPFGAPAIQVDAIVEQIQWDLDDKGEAFVTLQCSPVDPTPYGVLASWHATLNTSAGSGTATLTINASADTTNPLAAQIAPGQQLVLEPASATNAETVTVASVSATSAGWATAVITLSANLTKTHAANAVVCEPLPSGVTDPTVYDAVSKLDSIALSY